MVLRIPIWAIVAVAVPWAATAASCAFDVGRCDELRLSARGQVNQQSRGCQESSECRAIATTCGEWAAIRTDTDSKLLTDVFLRAEFLCGCGDGGAQALTPAPPTLCLSGVCRVAAPPPDLPTECAPIRSEIAAEIEAQNACAQDSECTALNVLTCPPICGQPTAVGANVTRLNELLARYDATGGCRACGPTCEGRPRPRLKCLSLGSRPGRCVDAGDDDGGPTDGGATDGGTRMCTSRVADARSGWTLTWTERAPNNGISTTLLLRSDGVVAVSPPGVQEMVGIDERDRIVALADAARLLCIDSRFHVGGDATVEVEITATVPGVGLSALRYARSDTQPSGLPALEEALRALARRIAP